MLEQLDLPALPVGESELASGGWIALLAIVLGTLFAAIVGGKAGERYHRASIAPDSSTERAARPNQSSSRRVGSFERR